MLVDRGEPPWVIFVCQDEPHRDKFLSAADRDLTGSLWHPSARPSEQHYPGRRRVLFASEADIHAGVLRARRVPGFPPGHPGRRGRLAETRGVRLPGHSHDEHAQAEGEPLPRVSEPPAFESPQQTLEAG